MKKRIMAWLMVLVMALTLTPVTGLQAKADSATINLGTISWSDDKSTYTFPGVTVGFADDTQKIFCISVDNNGYFEITNTEALDKLKSTQDAQISGVAYDSTTYTYSTELALGTKFSSISVICRSTTSGIKGIEDFIKSLKFYRNGVAETVTQNVTAIANTIQLDDDTTALAIDGVVHYYKYVPFMDEEGNKSNLTWYESYAAAKNTEFNGLKGYLATITSSVEQTYVYQCYKEYLKKYDASINDWNAAQAWIGGMRTFTSKVQWDSDSIDSSWIDPGERQWGDAVAGKTATTWYWMCGPEAGKSFYQTGNAGGRDESISQDDSVDLTFDGWNTNEPNNTHANEGSDEDGYQEYALEFGYTSGGWWNDYSPYNVTYDYMKGYIVEFSPYSKTTSDGTVDIKEDTPSARSEVPVVVKETDSEKNVITDASLDKKAFVLGDTISVNGVSSQNEALALKTIGTNFTCQWQVYDETTSTWKNISGATQISYTPTEDVVGSKVRCEITGMGDYTGTVYVDATTSNSTSTDVPGTIVTAATIENPSITAQDFIVSKDETEISSTLALKNKANVTATNPDGDSVVEDVTITKGSDNVTGAITVADGDTFTFTNSDVGDGNNPLTANSTAYVRDEVTNKKGTDGKSVSIGANDFTITMTEEDLIGTEKGDELFKSKSGVIAIVGGEKVSLDQITVESVTPSKKADGTVDTGKYDVTFSCDGVTQTVQATVEIPYIHASDFILSAEEAKSTDADSIKEYASVVAQKGTDDDPVELNSDEIKTQVSVSSDKQNTTITSASNGETFTFQYSPETGKTISTTATAIVVDEATTGEGTNAGLKIGANHFAISIEQAQNKATLEDLYKNLAGVVATDTSLTDTVSRSAIAIDTSKVDAAIGTYPVTFTYKNADGKSVSVTVNATVYSAGNTNIPNTTTSTIDTDATELTGNDFSVPAKGSTLDTDSLLKKGNVTAQTADGSDVPKSDITVNETDLEKLNTAISNGTKGEYPVTLTANGVQTTITVTVTDVADDKTYTDTGDNTQKQDTIAANNFTIGVEDYDKINNNLDNVVKLSNAKAYDTDTKETVAITSVDTSQVKNEPGTYKVTLTTANGTSATVEVTINKEWKTVGDIDKAADANKSSQTTSNPTAIKNTVTPEDTTGAQQTFEKTNPKDITEKLDTGRTVDTVSIDGTNLPGTSYSVSADEITIPKSVFSSYAADTTHTVQVTYKDGSKHTFTVKVIEYDEATVIKKVPILKMKKNMGVKTKFKLNLVGIDKTAKKIYKSSKKKVATINSNGVITAKKPGKTVITAYVIQNGSYYKVKVKVTVKKQKIKLYNLKKKALSKKSGDLPEFNVYKRVFKGKKTKLKFTSVEKDAKITYTSSNKKIATVTKKGVIKGKKQGFTVVTARIEQNGKTYVTRIFVRVDDNKTNKNLKKYLK